MASYHWNPLTLTHVVDPEVVQSPRNLDFLLGVEEGICKLFTLPQGTFDDFCSVDQDGLRAIVLHEGD